MDVRPRVHIVGIRVHAKSMHNPYDFSHFQAVDDKRTRCVFSKFVRNHSPVAPGMCVLLTKEAIVGGFGFFFQA